MSYKGYIRGNVVLLAKPLPVPDGTEVEILVPVEANPRSKKGRKKPSVAMETFGLIPVDPATVRKVLEESKRVSSAHPKSGFKRLAHQDRHPERSEGSRSEILRCAQNDSPEKCHGKVYQCFEFWFRP